MTAFNYRQAAANLTRAGWTCTGGMYPNSTAEDNTQVTWVAHFERKNGAKVDQFWLTSQTIGSPEYAQAVAGAVERPEHLS